MKMQVKISPKVIVDVEGETHVQLFEQLVSLQEIFGIQKCERCQGTDVSLNIRMAKGDTYYEMCCDNPGCWARLSFGQNKNEKLGSLYPRSTENTKGSVMGLEPGEKLPHGGWLKYTKEKGNH